MTGKLKLIVSNPAPDHGARPSRGWTASRAGHEAEPEEALIASIRPLDEEVAPSDGFRAQMKLRLLEMAPAEERERDVRAA